MAGGGQLARMTQQAAIGLGVQLRVLTPSPTDSAALVVAGAVLGDERAWADLAAFADECDVLTFDHEHVPGEYLRRLQSAGVIVRPAAEALQHAQDKAQMRRSLSAAGIPCPRFALVADADEAAAFGASLNGPGMVLKTVSGGYDGKGVWLTTPEDAAGCGAFDRRGAGDSPLLAEEMVDFELEVAAMVARRPSGETAAYPVVESVQSDGICVEVLAPAPTLPPAAAAEARDVAVRIADLLDVVGLLAVELFYTTDGRIVVNELAMRPHNTGHWSIDGARTSQFENHLRAVLDLPLGDTSPIAGPTVMVNLLGTDHPDLYSALPSVLAADSDVRVHLYGKRVRPGRKIGHVTVVGSKGADLAVLRQRARSAADGLVGGSDG